MLCCDCVQFEGLLAEGSKIRAMRGNPLALNIPKGSLLVQLISSGISTPSSSGCDSNGSKRRPARGCRKFITGDCFVGFVDQSKQMVTSSSSRKEKRGWLQTTLGHTNLGVCNLNVRSRGLRWGCIGTLVAYLLHDSKQGIWTPG